MAVERTLRAEFEAIIRFAGDPHRVVLELFD